MLFCKAMILTQLLLNLNCQSHHSHDNAKPVGERATEVGTASGLSAALGFVSPELFTLAGGLAATTPLTAPAAPFLFTTGQALRGQRLGKAGYGLLGGLVGETGGQVVEARGGTPFQAEVARFLGWHVWP
jgi:hypothetical protein